MIASYSWRSSVVQDAQGKQLAGQGPMSLSRGPYPTCAGAVLAEARPHSCSPLGLAVGSQQTAQ